MSEKKIKDQTVKIRLKSSDLEKLRNWADAYGTTMSAFVADRLIGRLPETPPVIPQPPLVQ